MPQAVALIQSPATLREYWKQRKRWALGGWHLLQTHKDAIFILSILTLYWDTYGHFVLSLAHFCGL
ncbi:hypothetical protein O163_14400 [Caldanaerobacter subterraneus subsp. yonseiensis KB-1]|uniref:Glycosyltransferase 2-like domain-containing protein n=1 Tax=Caldanaerobacter subterraneus subsp. yonseiensis KB-1 TaxID=1388761 RepID=U5CLP4_CALSX|nr:hypothetical protein O163_14400 [Caldanaerobacter subterraneus subsp. yonseiensis KB-1]